ncbi:MAG: leishmanolysin-related zinc metalloendopeptidase [Gemmatimonadota bacterium]
MLPEARATYPWLAVVSSLLLAGCGGGGEPSATATNIAAAAGGGQNAQVGSAVTVRPSVRLTDASGHPVGGVRVTFAPASGGGAVSGASTRTDANGIATVGSWTLGQFVGTNTLNATAPGVGTITFSADATAGAAARLVAVTALSQVSVVGAAVLTPPAVKVTDAFDNGVPGVAVTFAVTMGAGQVTGSPATTNAAGVATAGSWVLDPSPTANALVASVALTGITGNPVTFTAAGVTSAFNIDIRFLGSVSSTNQQAFLNAGQRLQALILNDLPNELATVPAGFCTSSQPAMDETIDDLVIFAQVVAIDGPGNVLGRAGPCLFHRAGTGLPIVGVMEFDVADLTALVNNGTLGPVILHEMLHVLGFGSVWAQKGLLNRSNISDPLFTGARAIVAFDSIGGTTYTGNPVPVENIGGPGTINSHWRETIFKNELMTGFINNGFNPLSVVTGSSLADMGYQVDLATADPFTIAPPFVAPPMFARTSVFLLDDIWIGPRARLDAQGRPQPIVSH